MGGKIWGGTLGVEHLAWTLWWLRVRIQVIGLVGGGGFAGGFEAFGQEDERGGDEGDDADDVEAVHEGEELGLGVELLVDAGVGGAEGVGGGEAVSLKVGRGLVDVLLESR